MIARLRRKIRQVHYYSARRRHTIWSRLTAWSMVTSLLGAGAAVLVAEQVVLRTTVVRSLRGGLAQLDSGALLALEGDTDGNVRWSEGTPYAEFFADERELRRGWPFATRIDPLPATLAVNVFTETGTRTDVTLTEDDPIRLALVALDAADTGSPSPLRTWLNAPGRTTATARRSWHTTTGTTVVWIMALLAAQLALIGIARLVSRYASIHRHANLSTRLAEGRCHRCGYDMRGLEFNARCPECGEIVR